MSKKQTSTDLSKAEPVALTLEEIEKHPVPFMLQEINLLNRRMEKLSSLIENIFDIVSHGPSADRFNEIQKTQRQTPLPKESK